MNEPGDPTHSDRPDLRDFLGVARDVTCGVFLQPVRLCVEERPKEGGIRLHTMREGERRLDSPPRAPAQLTRLLQKGFSLFG